MVTSFLSSRVKNLNIGVSGYTDNTDVLEVIGNVKSSGSFTSTISEGTAPLTVTSTTLVSNLNVDKLDGEDGAYYLALGNATGTLDETKGGTGLSTYATGDILYASDTDTLLALPIGSDNTVLAVGDGVPFWKSINAGDIGAIAGIDIREDTNLLGSVTTINFGDGITATLDSEDSTIANINIDSSVLASNTVNIKEDGEEVGTVTTINFGDRIIATLDSEDSTIANITFTNDPTFNTITLNIADGTAPLTVTSTTLVSNLNVDKLDGEDGAYYLALGNATGTLDETKGGTGLSTYATGDILYASDTDTLSALSVGDENQVLAVNSSGVPVWKSINAGDIGAIAGIDIKEDGEEVGTVTTINFGDRIIATLDSEDSTIANITFTNDPTFNTITLNIADGTAPLTVTSTTLVSNLNVDKLDGEDGAYYLALGNASGVLSAELGGTGQDAYAPGDILYSSAANTLSKLPIGSNNQVLSVSESTGLPTWKSINASDIGAISGIDIEEDTTNIGTKTIISFGSGISATSDPNSNGRAIVSLSLTASDVGIDIKEEGSASLGKATTLNFVGGAITAEVDVPSSTATITLNEDPTFSTITLNVAQDTPPLTVTSTTLVTNLNADLLDGYDGDHYLALGNASGVLSEGKGGTGQQEYTKGDILYSSAANTLSKLGIGTENQILSVSSTGIPEWINASGGASVTVSPTPPPNPIAGDLWYDSDSAALYVYYNDGNTSQWVSTSVGGGGTTDPQNLSELLDVDFGGTTPADKTVLTYSSTSGAWQPQAPAQYYASFRPSTSTQSVGTNGVTIDFDEIVVRSDNWPLATVNNSGYIYVPVTGKYLVTVSIYVDTTNTSTRNAMETWLYSNANGYVSRAMAYAYSPNNSYYYASTHMSAIISVTSTALYVCYAGASFNATAGYTTGNVTQDSRLNIVYLGE